MLSELPVRLDTKIENEAMSRLINIGAFVQDQDSVGPSEQLTALGRALALLPVHPTMGKMLILGSLFGCLGPILTIVSAAGEKLLRPMSTEAERAVFVEYLAKLPASESNSDHLLTQHLYQIAVDKRIHPPFLSYRGVKQIASARDQIEGHLLKLFRGKFPIDLNQNSDNHALQRLVLTAGLLPAVVVAMPDKGFYLCHVLAKNVPMAYASACHHVWNSEAKKSPEFFVYSDLVEQDRKRFVSNVTAIDPILLPLFGLEADWLGMHGVRALEEIEGLRNQWQPCVELMIQRDFLGAKLSQKQNDAVGRFRKAVISIANNTTTTHRRSRERGGILLL